MTDYFEAFMEGALKMLPVAIVFALIIMIYRIIKSSSEKLIKKKSIEKLIEEEEIMKKEYGYKGTEKEKRIIEEYMEKYDIDKPIDAWLKYINTNGNIE
ncbi:MAG: hypothetical protein HQ568_07995 [Calditrichaeota bacterium]|nr:hypothetical protein [Calditrichota bacterium]